MTHESSFQQAAQAIAAADALLIGAGAGMGVDSGLPDFRGDQGFWRAYPPFAKLGLGFADVANPRWFSSDPTLAWGFYGHRLNLYRATQPHEGFGILLRWARRMPHGAFVFTSNVDGHFQRAGFDSERILEVHGSIGWMQCLRGCGTGLFPAEDARPSQVSVDEETVRAREPLPGCPSCGGLARPNILMFGDWDWEETRTAEQRQRLERWMKEVGGARHVVVECGAGTAIPTVRHFCGSVAVAGNATLVRINLREPAVPVGHVGLALGALEALRELDRLVTAAWEMPDEPA